jgi:UDP-N-acetylmuramate--alanine ligase
MLAAKRLKVRTLPYATVLGGLTKRYATIAISGSHGKSTTTALAGLVLMNAGLDPTILIGTNLRELGDKNIRVGRGQHLVLEADDFGGAFLHYSPAIAIVTNIDREHLDFYKNFSNLKRAFLGFLASTRPGGTFILNRDDKNLFLLRARIAAIAKKNGVRVVWYSLRDPEVKNIRRAIKIPGEHNISNATAVYKLGKTLKIPEAKVLAAIGSYRGAWRRMEYRGVFRGTGAKGAKKGAGGGALVYDDYAHHPTEIKATLRAFREKYPKHRIVCVFQPHQMKRLAALFKEFTTAFDGADETLILPIYKVAGRDEKPGRYDSQALVKAIQKKQPKKLLFYLSDPKYLKPALVSLTATGPLSRKVIVMMGAGDIVELTDSLLS